MDKFLRLPEVMARVGLRKTAIYEQMDAGKFPLPVPLSGADGRSVGWRESQISAWIQNRIEQAPEVLEQRKALRQGRERMAA